VIVLEWLQGGALFDLISRRRLVSEKYLAMLFKKAVHALDNLHKQGLIHRKFLFRTHISLQSLHRNFCMIFSVSTT
jgi:hypothetical protein